MQPTNSRSRMARRARERKRKIRRMLLAGAAVLLLLAIGTGIVLYVQAHSQPKYERYTFDTNAMLGRIQNMTEEEIQQELNRVVEEGMFNISIASAIVFEAADAPGVARIENVEANRYHMQVDIHLDATGELVYASDLIRPGYYVDSIQLSKKLAPGEYPATATFSAITQQEMQLFGQAAAKVTLYVMDETGHVPTPTPVK